jgi:hypothetical protein
MALTEPIHSDGAYPPGQKYFLLMEQKRYKEQYSICFIEFEVSWETISNQALWKTIEQHVLNFGYLKLYLVSSISESIR